MSILQIKIKIIIKDSNNNMGKGLFISATSTGVGKTIVSAAFLKKLCDTGLTCCYYKPVQTGGIMTSEGTLAAPDCIFVKNIIGDIKNFDTFCSYVFKKPASPHLAANLENKEIDINKIVNDYHSLINSYDIVIIEGAGGLFVPLNEKGCYISDLIAKFNINMVLVANAGLGTINHTALSYHYATSKNINITGIILLSHNKEFTDIERDNHRILKKMLGISSISLIRAVEHADTDNNIPGDFLKKLNGFPNYQTIKEYIDE